MRFDVSELKTFNECGRKWQLSSRNAFHMRPKATNPNLSFGSLVHNCLHAMYLGGDPKIVVQQGLRELTDVVQQKVFINIMENYAEQVLPFDLEKYDVLDVEHSVHIRLPELQVYEEGIDESTGEVVEKLDADQSIEVCGSIDMLVQRKGTFIIDGFEHKTASKFRPRIYVVMDEQPRTYFIELQNYVEYLNDNYEVEHPGMRPYEAGCIIINELKKVQKAFEYQRNECSYSPAEVEKFKAMLVRKGMMIQGTISGEAPCDINPSYMKCTMCDYASICEMYQMNEPTLEMLQDEFAEEFEVRDCDHLDEKCERSITGKAETPAE